MHQRSLALALPLVALFGLAFAACSAEPPRATPSRSLGPGERWVPVASWWKDGQKLLCAGGGLIGDIRLHGAPDDPRLVWIVWPDDHRTDLGWPVGYSARFTPALELLDGSGRVIAHGGTLVTGGCTTADPQVWSIELATDPPPSS